MRLILGTAGLLFSAALACVSFLLSASEEDDLFYTGICFGLAAILVFMASVNGIRKKEKEEKEGTAAAEGPEEVGKI
ncbi:MAG: hypothetical protein LLG37_05430 [Spirochaetia bacterium]|nr:hypothetical protein [Spirochaetia bacterium]